MNILLVDDSKTMRNIEKQALAALGPVSFGEAGDGIEALSVISATPGGFHLVLVDWNMPNMNGLDLVTRIRTTDKRTPLIMVTTEGEKSRVLDAIRAGANNYVLKPFKPQELVDKVQATLARIKAA